MVNAIRVPMPRACCGLAPNSWFYLDLQLSGCGEREAKPPGGIFRSREAEDLVSPFNKRPGGGAADIPGRSGHENLHRVSP